MDKVATFMIGWAHIFWGYVLLGYPSVMKVTPLYYLSWIFGEHNLIAGVLLVSVGIMAVFSSIKGNIFLVWPQQVLLSIQLISITLVIASGHYPDQYVPAKDGRVFIFVDQLPAIGQSLSHTVALIWMMIRLKMQEAER